jgi:hypothetical protein
MNPADFARVRRIVVAALAAVALTALAILLRSYVINMQQLCTDNAKGEKICISTT